MVPLPFSSGPDEEERVEELPSGQSSLKTCSTKERLNQNEIKDNKYRTVTYTLYYDHMLAEGLSSYASRRS